MTIQAQDKPRKKVRLNDIARNSGVSISTVSAILSGSSKIRVSEQTRKNVLKIASSLNYNTPSRRQKKLSIRVFTRYTSTSGMQSDILSGIEEVLLPMHGKMLVNVTEKAYDMLGSNPDSLLDDIDGAIFISRVPENLINLMQARNLPAIVIGSGMMMERIPMVYSLPQSYMMKALEYLRDMGHKKAAFITGPLPHFSYEMSAMMFKQYGRSYGIINPEENIFIIDKKNSEADIINEIFSRPSSDRPTVLLGNISQLPQLLNVKGIKFPSDIGLLGFDSQGKDSGISYIEADNRQLAREAVNLLLEHIKNKNLPAKHIALLAQFHDLGSCGTIKKQSTAL